MISPNDTFTVYLDLDLPEAERKPEAERPSLVYRYGTASELAEHERGIEALKELHGVEYIDAVVARANDQLSGTRNLTNAKAEPVTALADALSFCDMASLARSLTIYAELSEETRKKFESPSPSVAAESAENAAAEPADA